MNNDPKGALEVVAVSSNHEGRLLSRIRLTCFLGVLLVTFATVPGLAQTSDSSPQGTPAATPPADTSTPAAPAAATPPAAAPAAPAPLSMPSMAGPLSTAIPHEIAAGPFGKLEVTGILSGMGWSQGNAVAGDPDSHWDVSNAQVSSKRLQAGSSFICKAEPTTCRLWERPSFPLATR